MLNGYYNKSKLPDEGRNQVACDFETPRKTGKNCLVPIDNWNECNKNNSYGYANAAPCIFLKLNRVSLSKETKNNNKTKSTVLNLLYLKSHS